MLSNNLIHNLVVIHAGDLKSALDGVRSEQSAFDFGKILPVPDQYANLTQESLFFFAFAAYVDGLKLGYRKLEKLLEPICDIINTDKMPALVDEYHRTLKLRYDSNGDLRNPEIYSGMPATRNAYIQSGELAYQAFSEYGAITDQGWKKINWNCVAVPEKFEQYDNQIYFESYTSIPTKIIDKWAVDHGLSLTLKSLDVENKLWAVNEYEAGKMKAFRYFDNKDIVDLLSDFQKIGKVDYSDLKIPA